MNRSERKDRWNIGTDLSEKILVKNDEAKFARRVFFVIGSVLFATVAVFFFLRPEPTFDTASRSKVAATIFPIYDIAKNVSEGVVGVVLILPPGSSPHTFDPSPKLVASLQNVEVLYAVGHGLDEWTFDLVPEEAKKVVVDKGLAIMSASGEQGDTDPHYWLSIPNGQMIARTIAEDLTRLYPEHKDRIEQNLEAYLAELDIAERNIKNELLGVRDRKMITMHDSWYYFAVHYGFDIIGTFEPTAGREPTPRYLAELSDATLRHGVAVIYSEPQVSADGIRPFALDMDLKIVELDPIGGSADTNSFKKLIQYNARIIKENQE